jgi:hypothetical protein
MWSAPGRGTQAITTIGLDIAKSVFQVHAVDAEGTVILRRQLKRRYVLAFFEKMPPCLVGIEACASSHHWSRELQSLDPIPSVRACAVVARGAVDAAACDAGNPNTPGASPHRVRSALKGRRRRSPAPTR